MLCVSSAKQFVQHKKKNVEEWGTKPGKTVQA